MLGKLREKLSGRRERRATKAYAEAALKREWERSGEVGRGLLERFRLSLLVAVKQIADRCGAWDCRFCLTPALRLPTA
jgi:hypothetical protein